MKAVKAHTSAWIVAAVLLLVGIGLFAWSQHDNGVRDRAFRAGDCGDHTCTSSSDFDDYMTNYKEDYQVHFLASGVCICAAVALAGYGAYLRYNPRRSKKSE